MSTSSSVPVFTSQSTSSTTVPSTSVSSALSAPVSSVQSQSQVLPEASLEDREIAEYSEAGASSSLSSSVTPVTVQSTPVAVSSVSPPTAVSPVSCCSAAPRGKDVSMSSELSMAGAFCFLTCRFFSSPAYLIRRFQETHSFGGT